MDKNIITINGVSYDAQTGLPVSSDQPTVEKAAPAQFAARNVVRPSQNMHVTTQKSQTLNRRVVKASAPVIKAQPQATKSPAITKFASHPAAARRTRLMDIAPVKSVQAPAKQAVRPAKKAAPIVQPVAAPRQVTATPTITAPAEAPLISPVVAPATAPKPSQILKQEAIAEALAQPTTRESKKAAAKREKQAKAQAKTRRTRAWSIASASLALLMLGGYFTYLNIPNLSVRVAAAQSGVNASYPGYRPDGYALQGFVTYNKDTVSMKFAANGSPQSYTIDQTKKNWDSSAVLENYVKPRVGGSYVPYSERGLTIYTFGNNAAWVNNGILYTIDGDAPLSSDQILHIATSM